MKLFCDFCYADNPQWEYRIRPGALMGHFRDGTTVIDDGAWLACNLCAELIDDKAVLSLIMRALENNPTTKNGWGDDELAALEFSVNAFFALGPTKHEYVDQPRKIEDALRKEPH